MYIWSPPLLLLLPLAARAAPAWSWDTVQTYVHCANTSGEWNDAALLAMATTKAFVVFEKNHKALADPPDAGAERKIARSCAALKAAAAAAGVAPPRCLMYTESDLARTFYDLGHWVEQNKATAALFCNGSYVLGGEDGATLAYDFTDAAMRARWVARATDAFAAGDVDGAFVDGNRNGFWSSVVESCDAATQAAWAAGLNASHRALAETLASLAAANATLAAPTIVTNYPTAEAMALCTGGMIERGAAMKDIDSWKTKACGLDAAPCLLDYHVDHGTSGAGPGGYALDAPTLAQFLIGVYEGAYFGVGEGWSGEGASACAAWLHPYPEYAWPLGAPLGPYNVSAGAYGDVYTRAFASGTKVYVGQFLPPDGGAARPPPQRGGGRARARDDDDAAAARPPPLPEGAAASSNFGYCVFWANGNVTGVAANCDADF